MISADGGWLTSLLALSLLEKANETEPLRKPLTATRAERALRFDTPVGSSGQPSCDAARTSRARGLTENVAPRCSKFYKIDKRRNQRLKRDVRC